MPPLLVYQSAVCSQRGCSPVSRCLQIRPRDGPSLAAGAAVHPIQTVGAHVSLPQWSSATTLDRAGNIRRRHCPSSPAVSVIYRSHRASYTLINKLRSRVCRCWPESMEQSTSCCPLLCHIPTPSKKTLNLTFLDYQSHCDNCVF